MTTLVAGMYAESRDAVVSVKRRMETRPYLRIVLPCGSERVYEDEDDLPAETDPCDCGSVTTPHYFVFYHHGRGH